MDACSYWKFSAINSLGLLKERLLPSVDLSSLFPLFIFDLDRDDPLPAISQFVGMYALFLENGPCYLITFYRLSVSLEQLLLLSMVTRVNQTAATLDSSKRFSQILNIWYRYYWYRQYQILCWSSFTHASLLPWSVLFLTTPFFSPLELCTDNENKIFLLVKTPRYRMTDFPLGFCYFLYLCTCHRKSRDVYKMAIPWGACIARKQLKISTALRTTLFFCSLTSYSPRYRCDFNISLFTH